MQNLLITINHTRVHLCCAVSEGLRVPDYDLSRACDCASAVQVSLWNVHMCSSKGTNALGAVIAPPPTIASAHIMGTTNAFAIARVWTLRVR